MLGIAYGAGFVINGAASVVGGRLLDRHGCRGPFLLHDLLNELAVNPIFNLKSAIKGFHVRHLVNFSLGVQAVEKRLENSEAHFSQGAGGLVSVHASVQIRLGKCIETEFLI